MNLKRRGEIMRQIAGMTTMRTTVVALCAVAALPRACGATAGDVSAPVGQPEAKASVVGDLSVRLPPREGDTSDVLMDVTDEMLDDYRRLAEVNRQFPDSVKKDQAADAFKKPAKGAETK